MVSYALLIYSYIHAGLYKPFSEYDIFSYETKLITDHFLRLKNPGPKHPVTERVGRIVVSLSNSKDVNGVDLHPVYNYLGGSCQPLE